MQTQIDDFLDRVHSLAQNLGYYPRFVCDSRQIQKGFVFVAFKGEHTDGHYFAQEAIDKGASFCLVEDSYSLEGAHFFKVQDVLEFIKQVVSYKIIKYRPITIGITGSCGKTSTKYYLSKILEKKFDVFATFGNFNSQIGLPLALLSLEKKHQVAVIEMGMSHLGDITKLCEFIPLDYAIITSIGLAHAENFEDQDIGIARAKGEILSNQPKAFFNEKTNQYLPFSLYQNKVVLETANIEKTEKGVSFLVSNEFIGPCRLHIDADHLIQNLHLAIGLAYELGLTNQEIINATKELKAEKGRLEIVRKKGVFFIDDSYNASPSSMKSAITYLKQQTGKRKIALIGAMRELGSISEKQHLALYDDLKEGIDYVFFIGEETWPIYEKLKHKSQFAKNLDQLIDWVEKFLNHDDVVLIKGSHSTRLYTVLDSLGSFCEK